jgi:hypothetical protein
MPRKQSLGRAPTDGSSDLSLNRLVYSSNRTRERKMSYRGIGGSTWAYHDAHLKRLFGAVKLTRPCQ